MRNNKRRILSLDGGGIKGAFAAAFLQAIEDSTSKRIADHFDLIAGTSTGGIIALGLGLGMSAKEISEFYVNEGPRIFDQHNLLDRSNRFLRIMGWINRHQKCVKQLMIPKYDSSQLKRALECAFKSKRLGDSSVRLVIPAYAAVKEDVYVFKTRHHPKFQIDWKESAVNVALATAAAPTYFEAHSMPSGVPLIDGGIWANNPVGLAAVEARSVLEWNADELYIIRLGCTEEVLDIPTQSGYAGLLRKTTDLFMQGQSRGADGTAKLLSNHREEEPKYFSIQPKVPRRMFTLDGVGKIQLLCGIGKACARDYLSVFEKHFLYEKAEPFYPYPPN